MRRYTAVLEHAAQNQTQQKQLPPGGGRRALLGGEGGRHFPIPSAISQAGPTGVMMKPHPPPGARAVGAGTGAAAVLGRAEEPPPVGVGGGRGGKVAKAPAKKPAAFDDGAQDWSDGVERGSGPAASAAEIKSLRKALVTAERERQAGTPRLTSIVTDCSQRTNTRHVV